MEALITNQNPKLIQYKKIKQEIKIVNESKWVRYAKIAMHKTT